LSLGLVSRPAPRTLLAADAALALGLTATAGVHDVVADGAHQRTVEVVDRQAHAVQAAVEAEAQRYVDTLRGLAVAMGAWSDLTAGDFAAVTSKLDADALMGATGVAFVVAAADHEVGAVEARWRSLGSDGLRLERRQVEGREHRYVVLHRSLDGSTALGLDLARAAEPHAALDLARSSGRITSSSPYTLLKDRHLPEAEHQPSFTLAVPVYGGGDSPDVSRFRGWLAMGLHGVDFLGGIVPSAARDLVEVTLVDVATSQVVEVVAAASAPPAPSAFDHAATTLLAGREWRLTARPTARFLAEHGTQVEEVAVAGGIATSVLLAALVFVLLHARDRALVRVAEATVALRDDIERRKVVEADLCATRDALEAADRVKSDFVSCVSHELRTPLTSMLGYAEMLADGDAGELSGPQAALLAVVDRNARRLTFTVRLPAAPPVAVPDPLQPVGAGA
jgi:CHASE1-domain containing sensor protein